MSNDGSTENVVKRKFSLKNDFWFATFIKPYFQWWRHDGQTLSQSPHWWPLSEESTVGFHLWRTLIFSLLVWTNCWQTNELPMISDHLLPHQYYAYLFYLGVTESRRGALSNLFPAFVLGVEHTHIGIFWTLEEVSLKWIMAQNERLHRSFCMFSLQW